MSVQTPTPQRKPTPVAEQILQKQEQILSALATLMTPPAESEPAGQKQPMPMMIDLLTQILRAIEIQRGLLETVIGYIKSAPGSAAELEAALRRKTT